MAAKIDTTSADARTALGTLERAGFRTHVHDKVYALTPDASHPVGWRIAAEGPSFEAVLASLLEPTALWAGALHGIGWSFDAIGKKLGISRARARALVCDDVERRHGFRPTRFGNA